jgi:hypothetical protein
VIFDLSSLRSNCWQDFTPKINLSEEDFAIMTRGGALLDDDGLLSMEAFEVVMKDQVKRFVQRQLTNILAIGRCSDAEEVQISTMKSILHEQVEPSTQHQRFCLKYQTKLMVSLTYGHDASLLIGRKRHKIKLTQ